MTVNKLGFGFSARAARTVPQPINYLITAGLRDKNLISLAAGLVDSGTLPTEELIELTTQVMRDPACNRLSLNYGDTCGLIALRERVLEHIHELDGVSAADLNINVDNVLLGSGSQQLLYFVSDVLLDPGDIVITEWPTYFVYTSVLTSLGASVRAVEMDEQGMRMDSLEETLRELKRSGEIKRLKIVYTVDYYQNPTGITLSADRRPRLLELVREYSTDHRICLLEDAAYRELAGEGQAPATIKSYERDNAQVVLAQTFSKPFSPGLRTGYAILPDDLAKAVGNSKGNCDFGSSNFTQHLLWQAMRTGVYQKHAETLRKRYRAKRDCMLAALDRAFQGFEGEISWTRPGGGLYVWVTLPEGMDSNKGSDLFETCLAQGVLYVPGEYCFGPDPRRQAPTNQFRLTYGTVDEAAIEEGIARLAKAVRIVYAKSRHGAKAH